MTGGQERTYRIRHRAEADWLAYRVAFRETDLWIRSKTDMTRQIHETVVTCRHQLETHIAANPAFLKSLVPIPADPLAPHLIKTMIEAAEKAGVGPMAAVAGAIAQRVGEMMRGAGLDSIVENGGDCFIDLKQDIKVGIHAGDDSPFRDLLALNFRASRFPLAVCTSSSRIGHSLSLGKADIATVVSRDAALADAAATAVCNRVQTVRDLNPAAEFAMSIPGVEGVLILLGEKLAIQGAMELCQPG